MDWEKYFMLGIVVVSVLAVILFIVFAVLAFLDGYKYRAKEGYVIGKYHEPEGSTFNLLPAGNPSILVPIYTHYDEAWVLVIENDQGVKGRICVSKRTWKQARNGQYISAEG